MGITVLAKAIILSSLQRHSQKGCPQCLKVIVPRAKYLRKLKTLKIGFRHSKTLLALFQQIFYQLFFSTLLHKTSNTFISNHPIKQKCQNNVLCGNLNMIVYHHNMNLFLFVITEDQYFLLVNLKTPQKIKLKSRVRRI